MYEQSFDTYENKENSYSSLWVIQFPLEAPLFLKTGQNYLNQEVQSKFENIEFEKSFQNIFPIKDIAPSENIEIVNNQSKTYNDLCIEISEEKENISYLDNSQTFEKEIIKEGKIFFISKKTERTTFDNIIQIKVLREDNFRIMIGTNFFNTYLKNCIENIKKACGCIKHFYNFPKKFIHEMVKKRKRIYLDYSLEKLLEDEELYKNKDSEGYYSKNLKVINELKSEKNKDIMEKNGYNKILKMNYKELFEEYLKSGEFQKKIEKLNSKNKIEAEKFEYFSNSFIKRFL